MKVEIRPLLESDWPIVMAWRSNPLLYSTTYTQKKPLLWEEHSIWMRTRGPWWRFWVVEVDNRPVGVVNLGQLDNWSPEIAVYIGELSLWGQGIGTAACTLGIEWLRERGYCEVHATVMKDNPGSLRMFQKLGFVENGTARKDEMRLVLTISEESNSTKYTSGRTPLD